MKMALMVSLASLLAAPAALAGTDVRPPDPAEMKTLGLIGGTSWYSTIDYYRYINQAVNETYGNNTNPPLLLYNLNQQRVHELQARNAWDQIADLLAAAAGRLEAGGAQGILFCANTPHKVYDQVARRTRLPILHIADATGAAIRRQELHRVGLIGTLYTMEDGFIASRLQAGFGIETLTPDEPAARRELHRIIHQELDLGIFKPDSKQFVLRQIEALRQRGAQGIVLGCTEFPLIIKQADLTLPVFDTTRLHSQMAVDFILNRSSGAPERQRPPEPRTQQDSSGR